ncbi:MAG: endonuclease/exonuclease/phosphatase family protein [Gemmobacter sp.]
MKQALARLLTTGYPASVRHIWAYQCPGDSGCVAAGSVRRGLRVASYNVHKCVGTDGRFDPTRIGRVIRELSADIVALQEVDRRFGDRLGLLDLGRLEAETGLRPVPVEGFRKSHGWRGNIILARNAKVGNVEQVALPGLEPRGALVADLEFAGGAGLRVIGAHLGLLPSSRRRQADLLADFMQDHPSDAILMGDLNEWRIDTGSPLARCMVEERAADHAPPSFPAGRALLPLDRIIASVPGALNNISTHRSALARIASDHLPITADWLPAPVRRERRPQPGVNGA